MKLIDVLEAGNGKKPGRIELFHGDLTRMPASQAVDVLVVSAFPGIYAPIGGTLIGALFARGLSVKALVKDPEADLRENFSCWLSRKIEPKREGLNFERILCFEPARRGDPPDVMGDIFQALAPFVFAEPNIRTVAMPLLAAGRQGYAVKDVLPPLLDAAFHRLSHGFPLATVKIVALTTETLVQAKAVFAEHAVRLRSSRPSSRAKGRVAASGKSGSPAPSRGPRNKGREYDYHVFISYSRKNEPLAQHLYQRLVDAKLRVFIDQVAIKIGNAWQQEIYDALDSCQITAVLYSPAYLQSKVCKEELNIALMRRRESEHETLFPLLIEETELPTYMKLLNYADCRVNDKAKIAEAAKRLVADLKSAS
jgi:hypothetical protein